MKEWDGFTSAAALLPPPMRERAMALGADKRARAEELRLRVGRPASVLLPEGELPFAPAVTARELDTVLETATRASAHTALTSVASGYVTVRGGCRVGLCGEAAVSCGEVQSLRRLSSLSIRVAREATGCADGVWPYLTRGGFRDTLLLSPPGGGKTTLLRELCRLLSDGGTRVSLIDERGEVAAVWEGEPLFDVGARTDVMTGAPKRAAALMLLRAMSPQVLAMDEITSPEDVEVAALAAGCGVLLLATAHARSVDELRVRPLYRSLLELGVFRRAVVIGRGGTQREYETEDL
jgi:stage III sporulation protein AA